MFDDFDCNADCQQGNYPPVDERLAARRISPKTAGIFQIKPDSGGWSYPAELGGNQFRWKNYDSSSDKKYLWLNGKTSNVSLYHGPNLIEAINRAFGACWYVSGEADVWAMHSAGIPHVMSEFTENRVIDNLAEILAQLGVKTLYIAPDRDDAGDRWARLIAARLLDTGIELDARRIPNSLGLKADVGRAWQQYERDGWPFERWLLGLERIQVEPEKEERKTSPKLDINDQNAIPAEYRKAIAEALGVNGFGEDGFSLQNVSCPFHHDERPSASLHKESGLYCFKHGQHYLWTQVGEKIGLGSLKDFYAQKAVPPSTPQLSTEAREALIRHGMTNTARLLDILYTVGVCPGEILSYKDMISEGQKYGLTYNQVYGAVVFKKPEDVDDWNYLSFNRGVFLLKQVPPEISTKNKRRGRKEKYFLIPSPEEVDAVMSQNNRFRHYDPISEDGLRKDSQYKAEVHVALFIRKPGCYTRKLLGDRLAKTAGTQRRYEKATGVRVTPQFTKEIMTLEDLDTLPDHRKGRYRNQYLENKGGQKYPPTLYGAYKALQTGQVIYLVKQTANHYSVPAAEPCLGETDTDQSANQ